MERIFHLIFELFQAKKPAHNLIECVILFIGSFHSLWGPKQQIKILSIQIHFSQFSRCISIIEAMQQHKKVNSIKFGGNEKAIHEHTKKRENLHEKLTPKHVRCVSVLIYTLFLVLFCTHVSSCPRQASRWVLTRKSMIYIR